jgi:hypothetical protein
MTAFVAAAALKPTPHGATNVARKQLQGAKIDVIDRRPPQSRSQSRRVSHHTHPKLDPEPVRRDRERAARNARNARVGENRPRTQRVDLACWLVRSLAFLAVHPRCERPGAAQALAGGPSRKRAVAR